jgi:ABC-type glycerol-3-phosphate transport system substrate-binding protein
VKSLSGLDKRKVLLVIVAIAFIITANSGILVADQASPDRNVNEGTAFGPDRENTYRSYLAKHDNAPKPLEEVIVPAVSFTASEDADYEILPAYEGETDVLNWESQGGSFEWKVEIPQNGLYNISIYYFPLPGSNTNIELEILIDGKAPFEDFKSFLFTRAWKDASEIKRDDRDNDVRPRQIENPMWMENDFKNDSGLYNEPYYFYFSKGIHTIRLKAVRGGLALGYIKIYNSKPLMSYQELYEEYERNGYNAASGVRTVIQGENAVLKSDPILHPMYDRSSPATEPSHPTKLRLNTIGQYNWRYHGQWISWQFDVPEDGLYKIGIRTRQNIVRGISSTRRIYIDGKVPFEEMSSVEFPFNLKWYNKVLGDEEPYLFYLTKGVHELKMEVIPGEMANTISELEDSLYKLNYLYRKILMITGPSPDKYRDYYLEKEVPDLIDTFSQVSRTLMTEKVRLENSNIWQKGNEGDILEKISIQLDSFIEKPDTIAMRLDSFKSNVSSLSAWMLKLKEQPLEIDEIMVFSPDEEFPEANSGFFESLLFQIKAIIGSFTEDYTSIGRVYEGEPLTVWVGMGRDQVQIIKEMVDDYFVPQTGIPVNVNLVQQGLIQATLSGKGPDIALIIGAGDPVNLAVRGALADLNRFPDFDEVRKRFIEQAMVPYEHEGKYYALPVQQPFPMMFYRKDILDELRIDVPQTWDDLYNILPVIQRNHMNVGIPSGILFDILLFQRGMSYYNEDRSATNFDKPEALDAFKQWTGFYRNYSFPLSYDFYSRFRTGEMPIGIANYTTYNQLVVAAPEIRNLWDMTLIPGTRKADGQIDRSVNGGGTACVIFEKTKDKDAAWEFIKWFTSEEIQVQFGRTLESLMGPAARYDTANVKAIAGLPWTTEQYDLLMEQMQHIKEVPQIPASYYVSRNLTNAFRKVCFDWANPRETLYTYNVEINKEIERKRIEFGLDKK